MWSAEVGQPALGHIALHPNLTSNPLTWADLNSGRSSHSFSGARPGCNC